MRHLLFASTCLFALSSAAGAETLITAKQTATIKTSTIKQGAPDDIRIASTGSVEVTNVAPAVSLESSNKVTNEGTIRASNTDFAMGIAALTGLTGAITNSGKIILDETATATDTDKDGDLDSPFATGKVRRGIVTLGAFTGDIVNTGEITVTGNDSRGISLEGPLSGNLHHDGIIGVAGTNAIGVATGDVSGAVRLAGTIDVKGQNAMGAFLGGNVAGTLTVQGVITATGYRSIVAPANVAKLDNDDLLLGGSALVVGGDVLGGIILAVAPKDSKEGSAVVRSYGNAAAMLIGGANRDVHVGALTGNVTGLGLVIDGFVQGSGVYQNIAARGLQIGGSGGRVTVDGGIGINGSVGADAIGATATALRLGTGATTPEIRVTGKVEATGSNAISTLAAGIAIDEGASVAGIRNSGTIKATATGDAGTAIAIVDFSGTVSLIENGGTISATGANSTRNIAIDVSEKASNVTVRQIAVAAGAQAPSIVGDLHFGGGNDLLDIADGTVKGNTSFGAGADTLKLNGDAIYEGTVLFGDGNAVMSLTGTSQFKGTANFAQMPATLDIGAGALFQGMLSNGQGVTLSVNGGMLDLAGPAALKSLTVTNKGTIAVSLGQAGNTTPLIAVSGTASFAAESKLVLRIADISHAIGTHLVLTADQLAGSNNIAADAVQLPWLYKATLGTGAKSLSVTVARRSNAELGLNRSEGAAADAVYAALAKDKRVAATFLAIADQPTFRMTMQRMLPDHAGGTFAVVTQGSRAFQRMLEDPQAPFKDEGKWGYWVSQVGWGQSKSIGDSAGFDISGWGIGTGLEAKSDLGNFGASLAYLLGRNRDKGSTGEVKANQFEMAAYWRFQSGRLQANARGSVGFIDLANTRSFQGIDGTQKVTLTTHADHAARLYSGSALIAYKLDDGRVDFRPVLSVDYYRLREKGYAETGGGDAFNLIVRARASEELTVTASAVAGFNWNEWSRVEIEGGRREIIAGDLGETIAQFVGGQAFTLAPGERTSGWIGRVRGMTGSSNFRIGSEFSAEQQQGSMALALRANLRVGF